MKTLIVGNGEIGGAIYSLLSKVYQNQVWIDDIIEEKKRMQDCPDSIEVIHICIRYSQDFKSTVLKYDEKYHPAIMDICTTMPVGTTESFGKKHFLHSTTRGLHPHLESGLRSIPKHIGGHVAYGKHLSNYFNRAGVECVLHPSARITELLHILNNVHYGINLMFADEAAKLCREFGIDYLDYLAYTQTNNIGFTDLGHPSKVRSILTPPNGRIGGHCVVMSANLIPTQMRKTLIDHLAHYNDLRNI